MRNFSWYNPFLVLKVYEPVDLRKPLSVEDIRSQYDSDLTEQLRRYLVSVEISIRGIVPIAVIRFELPITALDLIDRKTFCLFRPFGISFGYLDVNGKVIDEYVFPEVIFIGLVPRFSFSEKITVEYNTFCAWNLSQLVIDDDDLRNKLATSSTLGEFFKILSEDVFKGQLVVEGDYYEENKNRPIPQITINKFDYIWKFLKWELAQAIGLDPEAITISVTQDGKVKMVLHKQREGIAAYCLSWMRKFDIEARTEEGYRVPEIPIIEFEFNVPVSELFPDILSDYVSKGISSDKKEREAVAKSPSGKEATKKFVSTPGAYDDETVDNVLHSKVMTAMKSLQGEVKVPLLPFIYVTELVQLEGCGELFSGRYVVMEITHYLGDRWETELTLVRYWREIEEFFKKFLK